MQTHRDASAELLTGLDQLSAAVAQAQGSGRERAQGDTASLDVAMKAALAALGADRGALALLNTAETLQLVGSQGMTTPAQELPGLTSLLRTEGVAALTVMPLTGPEGLVGSLVACHDSLAKADVLPGREAHGLSHAELLGVLEAIGEGVVVRGVDGELLWANGEAARMLGVATVQELLTTPVDSVARRYAVFDADGRPVGREDFPGREALRVGGATEKLLRYQEIASGAERWVLVRGHDLRDGADGAIGSVTVFRDVTARQQALLARQESESRVAFLASAGPRLLAASLDFRGVLERVADLLVPRMADYCAIREMDQDGSARRLAIRHADPAKADLVARLEAYPTPGQALTDDLRQGRPLLIPELSREQLKAGARDAEHLAMLEELNPRSLLAVPVQAGERTIGVIILVWADSQHRYSEADAVLVGDLAQRAGLAIENSRLFEEERLARRQAETARAEVAFLLDASTVLSTSLDYEVSLGRLARLAAGSLCDLCLLDLVDDDGSVRRVATAAAHPDDQALAELLRDRYAPDPAGDHPAIRVIRSGQPEHADTMAGPFLQSTTRSEEHFQITQSLGFRSYVSVPLAARGRILGALSMIATHRSLRTYDQQDVALALDMAQRAALALDNARLHQETQLQEALLSSQNNAALEGVLVISPKGRVISYNKQLVALWGIPEGILAAGAAADALDWMLAAVEEPERFQAELDHLRSHQDDRARDEIRLRDGRVFDQWSAPLRGADGAHHGRAWYFRDISDAKEAQAERLRLYDAERAARLEAETSRARLGFLLEASTLLASSLDVEAIPARLTSLVARTLADACAVHLVDDAGTVTQVASAPGAGVDLAWDEVVHGVLADCRPCLVAGTQSLIGAPAGTAPGPGLAGAHSYVVVPLLARGRPVGTLSMATVPGGRPPYAADDLALVQDLGRRLVLAMEHARLYGAERRVATTLQKSLLPPDLPDIPGVTLAARYRAASAESEVGGDFYDLFAPADGIWTVVIGDISGKGVEAASLTALARYTVRAAARENARPQRVLRRLNEAVLGERPGGRFLTIAVARLTWTPTGALRLQVACGGHPPPLVLRAGGAVTPGAQPGTLIGFLEQPELPEQTTDLAPGDAVIFFTDGLTDVRGPEGTFGEDRLRELLAGYAGLDADAIATSLEREVLAFQAGEPSDDLAIVVLKVLRQPTTARS